MILSVEGLEKHTTEKNVLGVRFALLEVLNIDYANAVLLSVVLCKCGKRNSDIICVGVSLKLCFKVIIPQIRV